MDTRLQWGLTMTVDRVATQIETFDLTVIVHDASCTTIGNTTVCPVNGRLTKPGTVERYDVVGSFIVSAFPGGARLAVMNIEFLFRRVKILMAGPVIGDYLARYIAVRPNFVGNPSDNQRDLTSRTTERALDPPDPVNPDEGDTGTGTGSQTLVAEEQTQEKS